jgi:hypothetical protein
VLLIALYLYGSTQEDLRIGRARPGCSRTGFQVKWALDFPGAPLGAIEYILAHVIKKLGVAGVRSATFRVDSTGKLERADNVGGFRVMALEKTYDGLTHDFPAFFTKSDFRAKFGVHPEPVRFPSVSEPRAGD